MATTIVVLLDIEENCIRLFGEHNRTIPFEDIYLLPLFIEGKEVLYVKDGTYAFGNEVIETISDYVQQCELNQERRYFHTTQEGYLKVPDIKLTLAGKRDSKPIDQFGMDVFRKSSALRKYILDGTIEIIPESIAIKLKKQPLNKVSKDKALDDLIVKTSVNDILEKDDFFDDVDMITSEQGEIETEEEKNLKAIERAKRQ